MAGYFLLRRHRRLAAASHEPLSQYEKAQLHSDDYRPHRTELGTDIAYRDNLTSAKKKPAVELPVNVFIGSELEAVSPATARLPTS